MSTFWQREVHWSAGIYNSRINVLFNIWYVLFCNTLTSQTHSRPNYISQSAKDKAHLSKCHWTRADDREYISCNEHVLGLHVHCEHWEMIVTCRAFDSANRWMWGIPHGSFCSVIIHSMQNICTSIIGPSAFGEEGLRSIIISQRCILLLLVLRPLVCRNFMNLQKHSGKDEKQSRISSSMLLFREGLYLAYDLLDYFNLNFFYSNAYRLGLMNIIRNAY